MKTPTRCSCVLIEVELDTEVQPRKESERFSPRKVKCDSHKSLVGNGVSGKHDARWFRR